MRRLRRHYAVEQVDLLDVALLKPSPFGQHRWRLYRASHGHGLSIGRGMRECGAFDDDSAASMPAEEDRTALTAHPC